MSTHHTEEFNGNVSQMRVSEWLASEELIGLGKRPVVIEQAYKHENVPMEGGRREKVLYALKFKGVQKQMILNATNRKALSSAFGASVKEWKGKTVLLFAQDGVRKPGTKNETCWGLRVEVPAHQPQPTQAQEALPDA